MLETTISFLRLAPLWLKATSSKSFPNRSGKTLSQLIDLDLEVHDASDPYVTAAVVASIAWTAVVVVIIEATVWLAGMLAAVLNRLASNDGTLTTLHFSRHKSCKTQCVEKLATEKNSLNYHGHNGCVGQA